MAWFVSVLQKTSNNFYLKQVFSFKFQFSMDRGLRTKGFLGYMDLRTAGIVWGHIAIIFITSEFWTFINLPKLGQQLWLISYYYRFGKVDPLTVYIVYGNALSPSSINLQKYKFEFTKCISFMFSRFSNYLVIAFTVFYCFLSGIFKVSNMFL